MSPAGRGLSHLGIFSPPGEPARVGARRGEEVLDLAAAASAGPLRSLLAAPALNPLMWAGPEAWAAARAIEDAPAYPLRAVDLYLPFAVADYADFYSSLHHATNAGRIFRPDGEALPPNWRHLPVGYHGRAGTVIPSGTPVPRPHGQLGPGEYGPTRRLDIELELGFVIGRPSARGEPVPIERALDHVFGVVLLNDWSARDIQAWETRPLGPFLGKSFATSISHWVVPLGDLPRTRREPQDPPPLPYLQEEPWAFDVALEVELNGTVVARTNADQLYWSVAQQVAHLTVNGASLRTGDLLGSGTISGPERDQRGSLLELSWNGDQPIELADGSTRTFLEDGDEVVLRGAGLGEVRGRVSGR